MKAQINALTSTRAFAAIFVFIYHFGRWVYPFHGLRILFDKGNIAVSYFFVLSGFVLYLSYVGSNISYATYFKKRIARIVPVYYLALALSLLVSLWGYNTSYTPEMTKQMVYCTLFIQGYFPTYPLSINTAAWSLCAEMLFYVTFPFLLLLLKEKTRLFFIITILTYAITQVCFILFFGHNDLLVRNWNFFLYSPVMHINQFLIGMAGGYIFKRITPTQKRFGFLPFALFCLILIVNLLKPNSFYFEVGFIAPLFMLYIIAIAVNNPKRLNIRPLVFLGEISYGIYILQFPVQTFLTVQNAKHNLFSEDACFYYSLALLILVATLSYYLIEKPLRKRINAIGVRRELQSQP